MSVDSPRYTAFSAGRAESISHWFPFRFVWGRKYGKQEEETSSLSLSPGSRQKECGDVSRVIRVFVPGI